MDVIMLQISVIHKYQHDCEYTLFFEIKKKKKKIMNGRVIERTHLRGITPMGRGFANLPLDHGSCNDCFQIYMGKWMKEFEMF